MYISSKFKGQLSVNWHLNLSKVCATQSRTLTLLEGKCSQETIVCGKIIT